MAVYSTNQVRQLYVAYVSASKEDKDTLIGKKTPDNKYGYFEVTNALGEKSRTDLIPLDQVIYATFTDATRTPYKSVKVSLNPEVNEGSPIVGQDYVLNIYISQYVGMSDTDIYVKQGVARGKKAGDAAAFYKELAASLELNFKREPYQLFTFKAESDGVLITEYPQEWRRGVKPLTTVHFDVRPSVVIEDGEEVVWGVVTDKTPKKDKDSLYTPSLNDTNSFGNGKEMADLEYFCMGERADMYRGINWPHNLETAYFVDPNKEYRTINIHYAYVGANEGPQKSEKDITILFDKTIELANVARELKLAGIEIQGLEPSSISEERDQKPEAGFLDDLMQADSNTKELTTDVEDNVSKESEKENDTPQSILED